MSRRTEQRRAAVFVGYQHDVTGRPLHELFGRDASLFTRALAHAAADHREQLDDVIGRHSRGWTVERIAPLERNVMRVALLEVLHPDVAPGETPIPAEGAIDEAVQTAKEFCGAEAPGFVNGVLAAALRAHRAGGAGTGPVADMGPEGAPPADPDPDSDADGAGDGDAGRDAGATVGGDGERA